MTKRYDKIMDKIEVTDETKNRILNTIQNSDISAGDDTKVIYFHLKNNIKKYLSMVACLVFLLIGSLTVPNIIRQNYDTKPGAISSEGGIVTVASIDELESIVGFEIEDIPYLPFEIENTTYTAYWDTLGEICYSGEGKEAIFRKSVGDEDNSGDYNTYDSIQEIQMNSYNIMLKGNDKYYTLATWTDGKFSYSMHFSDGITESQWDDIIHAIYEP